MGGELRKEVKLESQRETGGQPKKFIETRLIKELFTKV